MATVTAGNSASVTISGDQTVAISVNHNNSGRFQFVPSNSGSVMGDAGTGRSFGPLPTSITYGPFGVAGTLTVYCDVGTVTYTVNASAFNSVAITGGSIDGTAIGASTPAAVKTSNLQASYTDSSATPGNVTNNSPRGKAAFAAAGSAVTVTSSLVATTSSVFVSLETSDATLTSILRVTPAAGSFTVTGNAAATAATTFSFFVVN